MHSRSVYLAAALISSTQFTSGNGAWILLSILLVFLFLPYGQLIITKRIHKRPKIFIAKQLFTPIVIQSQQVLERAFERVSQLENRLENICEKLQRKSPVEGFVDNRRITMSDSNLPTCLEKNSGDGQRLFVTSKSSASSADLRQVPSDLSHFRRRIDDSIREQRRTREIVEEAQDKLRNLRQHQAQVEASLASSNPSTPRFHSSDHYHKFNRGKPYLHRSMSSLDDEMRSKMFGTNEDKHGRFLNTEISNRPSSSDGRLKGFDKNVSFMQPPEFDVTIAWPFQPFSNSTPLKSGQNGMESQSELYASHNYRLMLLEDMLASCKLQLETSLRANATANSEIHLTRDKLQKLIDDNRNSMERAVHYESKYKHLLHLIQPRLYDLRNQIRSLQQRLGDVNLDVTRDMENYKENFAMNVKTLHSLIQRANCGSLRSRVTDLSYELNNQERQRREAESELYQHKRQILQLSNKIEQLTETLQSKETTITILEQDFQEEKERAQKLEEQNDSLFREKVNLREDHDENAKKVLSLRQKLEVAREERDKFESETRRLTNELANLRSASEARVEQLTAELNEAASALEAEREDWFRRQGGVREDFKKQTEMLQEKLDNTASELEEERNHAFDYKERIEELQIQLRKSEEHISELKRRVYTENTGRIQDLERQLANAQQIALQSTGDWKKYEQRVNELEVELHEYKLQFERERKEKLQAQHDFDVIKNELDRSEQILKETNSEKQQLLKSVNTFEHENRDLKKLCKQLNSEITICQKDTDSKYARVLEQKRTREQEEIKRLKMEMIQMEKTHSQREQNLLQRLNETNANFTKLKEQFDRRLQQDRDNMTSSTTTFASTTNPTQQIVPTVPSTSLQHPSGSFVHTSTIVRRTYHTNSTTSSKLGRQV